MRGLPNGAYDALIERSKLEAGDGQPDVERVDDELIPRITHGPIWVIQISATKLKSETRRSEARDREEAEKKKGKTHLANAFTCAFRSTSSVTTVFSLVLVPRFKAWMS